MFAALLLAATVDGDTAFKRGDFTAAQSAYVSAIQANPNDAAAALGLTRLAIYENDLPDAQHWLDILTQIAPNDPRIACNRATIATRSDASIDHVAPHNGLATTSAGQGTFAGGEHAAVARTVVDRLELGGWEIGNVLPHDTRLPKWHIDARGSRRVRGVRAQCGRTRRHNRTDVACGRPLYLRARPSGKRSRRIIQRRYRRHVRPTTHKGGARSRERHLDGVYFPNGDQYGIFPFTVTGTVSHEFFRKTAVTFDFAAM